MRHLLPNILPALIVQATVFIVDAILIESGLSYLGVGIQPLQRPGAVRRRVPDQRADPRPREDR